MTPDYDKKNNEPLTAPTSNWRGRGNIHIISLNLQ